MRRLFYFIVLTFLAISLTGCTHDTSTGSVNGLTSTDNTMQTTNTSSEATQLTIETLREGSGVGAKAGDSLTVNYLGTLTNGVKFDSSYDRGTPFTFVLGQGYVIQGWDVGMVGMKVGEKRRLTIPSSMGYGSRGMGTIPGNAVLIFEVELLSIQ